MASKAKLDVVDAVETAVEVSTDIQVAIEIMAKYTFVVCGEKGGVGKTWFAWLLIETLLKDGISPTIIDMDRTTPNVAKAYAKEAYKQWSGVTAKKSVAAKVSDSGRGKGTKIKSRLEELLSSQLTLSDSYEEVVDRDNLVEIIDLSDQVVISMPSQSQKGFCYWLDETDLIASSVNPQIVLFWVSDGSIESLKLLETFIPKYPDLKYCLVLNQGIGEKSKWERYELDNVSPTLSKLKDEGSLRVIDMEKLLIDPNVVMRIQNEGLTFGEIVRDAGTEFNRNFLNRLRTWLNNGYTTIKNTGYFHAAPDSAK
jgi:hypothetical protein